MKTTFKIFGLKEERIVRDAWLTRNGIETETELSITRHHIMNFENEFEAMEFISKTNCEFEHGFEIIKTFTNN